MRGPIEYIKGDVRIQVECKYPERFINICAREGVAFKELTRNENVSEMTVSIGGYRKLREVSRKTGIFTVKPVERHGVPFLLWRVRKRYALLAGLILCLGAVWFSSFFIWQIDVEGNETVPTWQILSCLKKLGVDIGSSTLSISQARLSNEMLLMIPELSWITLNTHGSRLEVLVREETPKPELIDESVQTEVYAGKAGIITDITVNQGVAQVSEGDTVAQGDMLIAGEIIGFRGAIPVRADGEIWARTWYELTLEMPLETVEKRYTGESTTRTAIIIGGKRLNLYFSSGNPYAFYDKITTYDQATLGDAVLPFTVVKDTYQEYEPVSVTLAQDTAQRILSARLLWILEQQIGEGTVVSTEYQSAENNGVLQVTLRAECTEQIGESRAVGDDTQDSVQEGEN